MYALQLEPASPEKSGEPGKSRLVTMLGMPGGHRLSGGLSLRIY